MRHEIACHSFFHPHLENLPISRLISEIYEDKRKLEELAEKPVCGMAYPYGTFDRDVKDALRAAGILYSRTTGGEPVFYDAERFSGMESELPSSCRCGKDKVVYRNARGKRSSVYLGTFVRIQQG